VAGHAASLEGGVVRPEYFNVNGDFKRTSVAAAL